MFNLSTNQSKPIYNPYITGGNDPTTTNAQKYSQIVQNSQGNVLYRGVPNLANTSYTAINPIFSGDVLIQGNIDLYPSLGTGASTTGWLNVNQNVNVSETIYTNNICVSGILQLQPDAYFSTLNIGSLNIVSYTANVGYTNILNVSRKTAYPVLVMLGNSSIIPIFYSTDIGTTWTKCFFLPNGTNNTYITLARSVLFNGLYWISVGCKLNSQNTNDASIMYSSDAITWIPVDDSNLFGDTGGYGIAYDGTKWIACGDGIKRNNGTCLISSIDGKHWSDITSSSFLFGTGFAKSIVFNNKLWVAGGGSMNTVTLINSIDGITWNTVDSNDEQLLSGGCTCVAWNGSLWLASGGGTNNSSNNFAYSYDGSTWISYSSDLFVVPIVGIRWSDFLNQWMAIGGCPLNSHIPSGSILAFSNDGITWTDVSGIRSFVTYLVDILWESSSKLWIATGVLTSTISTNTSVINVLVTSPDGQNWTLLSTPTNNSISAMVSQITCNSITSSYSVTGILNVAGKSYFADTMEIVKTLTIQGGLNSVSANTGTLIVQGGVGIQKTMYVGGDTFVTGKVWYKNTPTDISWVQLVNQNQTGIFNTPITISATNHNFSVDNNALTIYGGLGVQNTVFIASTNNSIDTNSGAIIVKGGAGIVGNVNIGNNLGVNGLITSANMTTGSIIATGEIDISGNINIQNNGNNALTVDGGVNIARNILVGGNIQINGTQISTGYTSGALTVAGGIGIGGSSNLNGDVFITSITSATNTNTGSLVVAGGIGIGREMYVGGLAYFQNTKDSTSTGNGSLIIAGGVGIQKSLNVGGSLSMNGGLDVGGSMNMGGSINMGGSMNMGGGINMGGGLNVGGGFSVGPSTAPSVFSINNGIVSITSTDINALQISGGIGIGGAVNVTGDIRLAGGNIFGTVNGNTVQLSNFDVSVSDTITYQSQLVINNTSSNAFSIAGGIGVNGNAAFGNSEMTDISSPLYNQLRLYYPFSTAAVVDCSSGLPNANISYINNGGCVLQRNIIPPPPVGSANNSNGDGNGYALYIPTTTSSFVTNIYVPTIHGFTITFWSRYIYDSSLSTPLITLYDNYNNHIKLKTCNSRSGLGRQMIDLKMGNSNYWSICDISSHTFPIGVWVFNMVSVSQTTSTSTVFWQSYGMNGSNYQIATTLPVVFNPTLTQMTVGSYTISDISYIIYDTDVSSYVLIPISNNDYVLKNMSQTTLTGINGGPLPSLDSLSTITFNTIDASSYVLVNNQNVYVGDEQQMIETVISYSLTEISMNIFVSDNSGNGSIIDNSMAFWTDVSYIDHYVDVSFAYWIDVSALRYADTSMAYWTDVSYIDHYVYSSIPYWIDVSSIRYADSSMAYWIDVSHIDHYVNAHLPYWIDISHIDHYVNAHLPYWIDISHIDHYVYTHTPYWIDVSHIDHYVDVSLAYWIDISQTVFSTFNSGSIPNPYYSIIDTSGLMMDYNFDYGITYSTYLSNSTQNYYPCVDSSGLIMYYNYDFMINNQNIFITSYIDVSAIDHYVHNSIPYWIDVSQIDHYVDISMAYWTDVSQIDHYVDTSMAYWTDVSAIIYVDTSMTYSYWVDVSHIDHYVDISMAYWIDVSHIDHYVDISMAYWIDVSHIDHYYNANVPYWIDVSAISFNDIINYGTWKIMDVSAYLVTTTNYSKNLNYYQLQDVSASVPKKTLYDPITNYYAATNPFYLSDLRIYSTDISNTLSSWFCNIDNGHLIGSAFDNNVGGLVNSYGVNAIGSVNSAVMNTGIMTASTVIASNVNISGKLTVNGTNINSTNPTGSMIAYAGTTDPVGWVICDGIVRTNNQDGKYNSISSMGIGFGGSGISNYTPPNMIIQELNISSRPISWILKL